MAERAYTRFEVSIGSRYSWTTFPNLSTTGLKIRCERGNGDAACFQLSRRIPPSLRGGRGGRGGGEGREEGCIDGNRCKLEARFLSARRRASKSALFILLVENGVEIFGKKEKLFGW